MRGLFPLLDEVEGEISEEVSVHCFLVPDGECHDAFMQVAVSTGCPCLSMGSFLPSPGSARVQGRTLFRMF